MPSITHTDARELAAELSLAGEKNGAARILLLDLDGTLAPIADTPQEAEVPKATLDALDRLVRTGWRVAVISGRPRDQVLSMVPVEGILAFGSHGLEGTVQGSPVNNPVDQEIAGRIEQIALAAESLVRSFPGAMIERKPAGVAFHHRLVPDKRVPEFLGQILYLLSEMNTAGLEVIEGRRVLELRPCGANKGAVVERIAAAYQVAGEDASFLAAGDDLTDEDMFRAMEGLGLSVMIGGREGETIATRRLDGCDSMRTFLETLAGGQG